MVSHRFSTDIRWIGEILAEERIYKHNDGRCTIVLARQPFDQTFLNGTINRVCQCEYEDSEQSALDARTSVESLFRDYYEIPDESSRPANS